MNPTLVALGVGVLVVGTGVILALLQMSRTEKRMERVVAVAAPYRRAVVHSDGPTFAQKWQDAKDWLKGHLASIFKIDLDRAGDYPLRWWMVLILAAPLARLIAGLLGELVGQVAIMATPVIWLMLCRAAFTNFDNRRRDQLYRQFPDALGMIVRAVRVGIPVTEALRAVATESPQPTAKEFGRAADQISIGIAVPEALASMATHSGMPEYRFFATALALQSQTGGGLAETLDNLADVIRKRVALRTRANALSSEAKASAGILIALPFIAGTALAVVNPSYASLLFADGGGRQVLAVAAILLSCGVVVMRGIIKKSLS